MKNPKELIVVKDGAEYTLPTYFVDENGLQDGVGINIKICKGAKDNPKIFRQEGVITESVLEMCRQYLVSVNKGDLLDKHSELAIAHIDAALKELQTRQEERKARGVWQTYKA